MLIGLTSCQKRGCTDTEAENFEPKAKEDCGCCYFWGKGMGYYYKSFYDKLKSSGATYLKFYVNGEFNGQNAEIPVYSSGPPSEPAFDTYSKGDSYRIILTVDLGMLKQKKVEVKINDQKDKTVWKDSVLFTAAKVTMINLF